MGNSNTESKNMKPQNTYIYFFNIKSYKSIILKYEVSNLEAGNFIFEFGGGGCGGRFCLWKNIVP